MTANLTLPTIGGRVIGPSEPLYPLIRIGSAYVDRSLPGEEQRPDLNRLQELAQQVAAAGGKGLVLQCMYSLYLPETTVDEAFRESYGFKTISEFHNEKLFHPVTELPLAIQIINEVGLHCILSVASSSDLRLLANRLIPNSKVKVDGIMVESIDHANSQLVADAAYLAKEQNLVPFIEVGIKQPDSVPNAIQAAQLQGITPVVLQAVPGMPTPVDQENNQVAFVIAREFGIPVGTSHYSYLQGETDPAGIGQRAILESHGATSVISVQATLAGTGSGNRAMPAGQNSDLRLFLQAAQEMAAELRTNPPADLDVLPVSWAAQTPYGCEVKFCGGKPGGHNGVYQTVVARDDLAPGTQIAYHGVPAHLRNVIEKRGSKGVPIWTLRNTAVTQHVSVGEIIPSDAVRPRGKTLHSDLTNNRNPGPRR